MKQILISILLIFATVTVAGQQSYAAAKNVNDCSDKLRQAEACYQAGLFTKSVEILIEAIDSCDYPKIEKEQALELLAKSYVETEEPEKAESSVNLLLKNFPHYELIESRNPEIFNRMVKRYEIRPKLTIGLKAAGDWYRHKTIKTYSVLEGLDYSPPIHDSSYFFTFHGFIEYEFMKGLSINIEGRKFSVRQGRAITKLPSFVLYYQEDVRFLEFPVYLKKYFDLGKDFSVYASAGSGLLYFREATGIATLTYTEEDIITGKNADFDNIITDINMLPLKNRYTGFWNAGIGIGYTYRNLRFFIDTRYIGGLNSVNNPENSHLIPELRDVYFYIDQEVKVNHFEAGFTISYTLLNSVKRIRK